MFAVLRVERTEKPGFFRRLFRFLPRYSGLAAGPEALGGTRVVAVTLRTYPSEPEKAVRRRVRKAGKLLFGLGVRDVVAERGFSYYKDLGPSLRRPPAGDYFRREGAELLLYALEALKNPVMAALFSRRPTSGFLAAAEAACRTVQKVGIYCGTDDRELAEMLRSEYGVSACTTPAMLGEADVLLLFDEPDWLAEAPVKREALAIFLDGVKTPLTCAMADGARLAPPPGIECGDLEPEDLALALYYSSAAGGLRPVVRALTFRGEDVL